MFGKCPICGERVGFLNLKGSYCKACLEKEPIKRNKSEAEKFIAGTAAAALIETGAFDKVDIEEKLEGKSSDYQLSVLSGWPYESEAEGKSMLDRMKKLIADGANMNSTDPDSYSIFPPLHSAASRGHLETVNVLLENGADPNLPDKYFSTALMNASGDGHLEVVKSLLKYGADVNLQQGSEGSAALSNAAYNGYLEIVKVLLENGADIHARPERPALVMAVFKEGNVDVVAELLDKGAHLGNEGQSGREALSEAMKEGNERIASLIRAKIEG